MKLIFLFGFDKFFCILNSMVLIMYYVVKVFFNIVIFYVLLVFEFVFFSLNFNIFYFVFVKFIGCVGLVNEKFFDWNM